MTRNSFNQAKQQTVISSTDRKKNLKLSKAHQIFSESNKKFDMKIGKIKEWRTCDCWDC